MKPQEKEIETPFKAHYLLDADCLNKFIRKSDSQVVQAKYSTYGNQLIWVIERDLNNAVIKSDIHTIDEFNDLYMTEEGWEKFK